MKRISIYLLLLIGLTFSCTGNREEQSGLLWKIISKEGKVGYIFGTIHLYPKDRLKISKEVFSKLKQCKTLALERNIKDSIDQKLFTESLKRAQKFLRTYQVISDQYGADLKSMEAELIAFADSYDIKLTGLETSTELLCLMDKAPNIAKDETDEYILEDYEKSINLYKDERIDHFANAILNKELGLETRKLLVDQRNKNWIDNIERLINQDNVFIAVGMGHLGGEEGLLNLLKEKGFQLERIKI
ncbi:TraB/GumN family protein [Marivirga sp.]|uniref:TraB/GumN family protein n=1 Tax=Marivirga sp. TaxID=2018662 RepID=UPI002D7FA0E3|nr:TraB/GumN family protein [Marivirga sp.]HET8860255.1 TraB/GumN family protein [Marivirga sp.]